MEDLGSLRRNNRNLVILLFIATGTSLIVSCTIVRNRENVKRLVPGRIDVNAQPDTCGNSKCYRFTTTSDLVAESQGGVIRIDEPREALNGTIVLFSGGLGTSYVGTRGSGAMLIEELRNAGYRVMQVKWDSGWFKGAKGKYEGFKKLAVHPAIVTQHIYNKMTDKGKPFVLFGGSGGAAQIAYMLSFYGLDKITTSALAFGGFWMGRMDIGCFDKDSLKNYMHYSEPAKTTIDISFGFDSQTKGPCKLCDTSFVELYKKSSASFGGNYYYPNTKVFLIYGGNDRVGALNQGLTYYHELVSHKTPFVHMQVIDGAPHSVLNDSTGYIVMKNILLSQISSENIIPRLPNSPAIIPK